MAKQMISDMCTCGLVYNLFQRPIGITVRCCDQHYLEIRCWNSWNMGKSRLFPLGFAFVGHDW